MAENVFEMFLGKHGVIIGYGQTRVNWGHVYSNGCPDEFKAGMNLIEQKNHRVGLPPFVGTVAIIKHRGKELS
jgi:hypothetical protein